MKLCELYKKGENNRVQCTACCHKCVIEQGKIGLCGTRKNFAGELYSMVYGRIASIGLDPIEKKPLFHFRQHRFQKKPEGQSLPQWEYYFLIIQ